MSLETAMENLAVAMTRYADVVEKYGLKIEGANTAKAEVADKPAAKGKAADKPAAKGKAAADNDGFGEDEDKPAAKGKAKKALTHDDVKAKLLEVKEANGGDKQAAIDIISEYGYAGIPSIKEKDFEAIFADAEKWLEDNA